jgi:hypothetical protein
MLLTDPTDKSQLKLLEDRYLDGAGFVYRPGGKARPDATCWAILALQAAGGNSDVISKARKSLFAFQATDGRVCVSPRHPDACWPTPLAVLAWLKAPEYESRRKRAIRFLLDIEQINVLTVPEPSEGHDGTIKGWPWIAKTHPWAEPTAYTLMALRAGGYLLHVRTGDAIRLLLDRQLPSGGWNYGNRLMFQTELRPMPETTGVCLAALAGLASRADVERSIAYLQLRLPSLDTPMSLAWAILGLRAWQEKLDAPKDRIAHVLARQEETGPYDTISLSLLLLAWHCSGGFVQFLEAG